MSQSIVFMDGMEDYATADLGVQWYSVSGGMTVSTSGPRTGSRCLSAGADNSGFLRQIFPSSQFVYTGWAVGSGGVSQNSEIFMFESTPGTSVLTLTLDGLGHIQLRSGNSGATVRATGTWIYSLPSWHHIGIVAKLDTTSSGYVRVYVDGVLDIDYTGITASASAAAIAKWGSWSGGAKYDDIIIATGDNGSAAANYPGDLAVGSLWPDGAGNSTQWTPNTGANWDAVNDTTEDGDTTYVADSTSGHKDTYTLTAPSMTGTVAAVMPVMVLKKDVAGTVTCHSVLRLSGTEVNGTSVAPGVGAYSAFKPDVYATKPGGGAWTTTDLTNLEAGAAID